MAIHDANNSTDQINFDELFQYTNLKFNKLASFDEIYFLGDHTDTFSTRALDIAKSLINFFGVVVFSISPEKRIRISNQLPLKKNWSFIKIEELIERSKSKNKTVLVIDFNDNLAGKNIAKKLESRGVTVRDCLFAMHQLNLVHTYLTIKEERQYVLDNLNEFKKISECFGDFLSKKTLFSRLKSILTLDRTALIEVSFPMITFMNNYSNIAGIVVRDDEVFVDAGAANGDTVSQFFHLSRGNYRKIHAFEPDSKNFLSLQMLCEYLPNTKSYFAGLGEAEGSMDFYEYPENRFGSNFFEKSAPNQVKTVRKIMKLDDVLDDASLIKIDVEGWESNVIKGAANIFQKSKPNLTISAYHYPNDIIEILTTVNAICKYKNIGLRHYSSNLFDTQLIFSDSQEFI